MLPLSEILKPRHVDLQLAAEQPLEAVAQLGQLLQGDSRVGAWTEFQAVLCKGVAERLTILSCGAALCHARTEGVTSMVMAAGRLVTPMRHRSPNAGTINPGAAIDFGTGDDKLAFRYVFVMGLPPTMAAEYLRVVGALARTLKDSSRMNELDAAESAEEFVAILIRGELAM